MSVLIIRLAGPMQSWGTKSRFYDRDTEDFPSKSGVLGVIGAALGRDRAEDISDLVSLKMGVRIINKGIRNYDYQVAGVDGFYRASGSVEKNNAIPYTKNYLSSADFLVGLQGEAELLEEINNALMNPSYPLFLGRKSYVASKPIFVADAISDKSIFQALKDFTFNEIIDAEIIDSLRWKHFDKENNFKADAEYMQTMIFDKDITIENHTPILITMLQDVPISFLSQKYRLREVAVYNIKYEDTEQYLSRFVNSNEKGTGNVSK